MSATSSARRTRPLILRTTWRAWASAFAATRAMPLAFVATAAAEVLVAAVAQHLAPAVPLPGTAPDATTAPDSHAMVMALFTGLPIMFVNCTIMAPLAVAVHRFVVLGERTSMLPLRLPSRTLPYAACVALFSLGYSVPAVFQALPPPYGALVSALVTFAILVATMRLTLLLPQIAVASSGERLRTHWNALRWRFWNTTTILGLAVVPVAALQLLATLVLFGRINMTTLTTASESPLMEVSAAPYVALGAAAMSWLFIAYTRHRDDPQAVTPSP